MLTDAADLAVDVFVTDGDLHVDGDLVMGKTANAGLLIVRGSLDVRGLLSTMLDPDTVLVVTGDVTAQRTISSGFFEVGGSLRVENESLWLDNDGCAEVFGDLRAGFLYTKYHAVRVHGEIAAELVLGDDRRFDSKSPCAFVHETSEEHKQLLRARLPAAALSIVGDVDDDEDWCIDDVDSDVLAKMVRANQRILKSEAAR